MCQMTSVTRRRWLVDLKQTSRTAIRWDVKNRKRILVGNNLSLIIIIIGTIPYICIYIIYIIKDNQWNKKFDVGIVASGKKQ